MTKRVADPVVCFLRRLVDPKPCEKVPDGDLLARYVADNDEKAFSALVGRHGAMVLHVCRSLLRSDADAEDAFQVTFLVLARQSRSIRKTGSLSSWLHGVAYRTALKVREAAMTRRRHEAQANKGEQPSPLDELSWREVQETFHEELARLPEKYRTPLVLCYLEGKRQDDAARAFGTTLGSFRGLLDRGREMLRARLTRRGIGLSAVLFGVGVMSSALASVPASLADSTIRAAAVVAAGSAVTGGLVSARVVALTQGMVKAMLITKLKTAIAVLVLAAFSLGAVVVIALTTAGPQVAAADKAPPQPAPAARDKAPKDDKDTDQKKIQGQWKLVDADDSDGLSKTEGFTKHTLVIEGDQMWKLRQGDKKEDQGTFKLASGKDPKQIGFKTGGKAKEGQDRVGIYALAGNKLTICFSSVVPVEEPRRPTDFTIKPGSGRVLLVYEREGEKPPEGKKAKGAEESRAAGDKALTDWVGLNQVVERGTWFVAEVDETRLAISLQGPARFGGEKELRLRTKTGTPADKIPAPPPEPDGLALRVAVEKNAEVVIDGRAGRLADVRPGMQVSVRMANDRPAVARIEAVTPGLATLKGIDVKKRTITVTVRGHDWTVPVAEDATITIDLIGGKVEARLADLKEGARVSIRLAGDGDKIVVKAVVVARE